MILSTIDTSASVMSGVGSVIDIGIKSGAGLRKIASILQDYLYKDKILAVIREISCNAMDAHVAVGTPSRPIIVRLPNALSPIFCIRDFGPGMTEERVRDVFANLGESTKSQSQAETGMFGIGSKSPFAYADTYMVISYQFGSATTYICRRDHADIVLLGTVPTTEENGLEVQINVKPTDFGTFITKAENFFIDWEITPVFEGATINFKHRTLLFKSSSWTMYNPVERTVAQLHMGNVTYPIDYSNVATGDADSSLRKLLDNKILLTVPIGTVDVAASREGLQYTAKTNLGIVSALKIAHEELSAQVKAKFDACATMFEKKLLAYEFGDYYGKYHYLNYLIGDVVSCFNYYSLHNAGLEIATYGRRPRGKRQIGNLRTNSTDNIECRNDIIYIKVHDLLSTNKVNERVAVLLERGYMGKTYKKALVLRVCDQTLFDEWKQKETFDIPLVDFASLPIVKLSELYPHSRANNGTVNCKNSKKIFTVDFDADSSVDSDYFSIDPIEFPTDGSRIPFVTIERYMVITPCMGHVSPKRFVETCIGAFSSVNMDVPIVAAIREGDVEKLDKTKFIPFVEYLTNLIKTEPSIQTILHEAELIRVYVNEHVGTVVNSIVRTLTEQHALIINKTGVAYRTIKNRIPLIGRKPNTEFTTFSTMYLSNPTLSTLIGYGENGLNDTLTGEFEKTYPLLSQLNDYSYRHSMKKNSAVVALIQYVNIMDESLSKKTISDTYELVVL